tara:strand:+ start:224 stop:433 length:210 start_codon:yes stop_codon:yes gene_type:complete
MNTTEKTQSLRMLTKAARENDPAISVRVEKGKFDVCRVTYPSGSTANVQSLTGFCSLDEAVEYLEWVAQ